MKFYNIILKVAAILLFLVIMAEGASAQQNIFRAGNVKITGSTAITYGRIEDINDGNLGTDIEFSTPASKTVELLMECLTPAKLTEYVVSYYYPSSNATILTLSGSQNSTTWTQIDTRTVLASASVINATVANTISYKYYKVVFSNIGRSSLDINEIEAYSDDAVVITLTGAPGLTGDKVNLSWNKGIRNTGSYELERSTNGIDFTQLFKTSVATITSYTDTARTPATDYWYRIRAVINQVNQPYSAVAKVTTTDDVLKDIAKLTAVPGNLSKEIRLNWTGLNIYTPGQFILEKSTDGKIYNVLQTLDKAITTYTDTTAARSTSYWYRLKGVNYKSTSPYSNIAVVTSGADLLVTAPTLNVVAGTTGKVANLSWSGLTIYTPGAFELERSINGTDFNLIKTLDKAISTFTDTTLTQSTSYWYRIRGINYVAPSPYSGIVKVTTKSDKFTQAPTLTAFSNSGTNATLTWSLTFNTPGRFKLEKSVSGGPFSLVGTFDKSVTAYTEESLAPNTTYQYRIRAYNYTDSSAYSNIASITTNNITSAQVDITDDGGTLAVSADNPGEEQSSRLIDNNVATKWLLFTYQTSANLSATYQPKGSYLVNGYTLTTANDAAVRDPKAWTFSGSNNGTQWTTLDTKANQLGGTAARTTKFAYTIVNPGTVAFKFYRINFTANNGASDGVRYQIAEWEILGTDANAPVLPANLKTSATTDASATLTWQQDASKPVSSYVLQRSTDGLYFNTVDTLKATPLTYTNNGLADGMTYYYRIKALGNTVTAVTGWSNVATAITQTVAGRPLSPVFLKITSVDDSTVNLSWKDRATDETKYVLQRSENKTTYTDLQTLNANTNAAIDQTVWPAKKYYYKVTAYKDNVASLSSNVDSAITPGFNQPPLASIPILTRNVCGGKGEESFTIQGLIGGKGNERTQTVKIVGITADSTRYFSKLSFTPDLVNGYAYFKVTPSGLAKAGDTAKVFLKIKDNGGIYNFGVDSTLVQINIAFTPITLKITANADVNAIPRNTTIVLTGETNYPATTTQYLWDNAPGIIGSKTGLTLGVRPLAKTTYTLHATSSTGCVVTSSITITPIGSIPNQADSTLTISNVITPNGDGKNDTWMINGIQKYPGNSVKILDRSGRVVFAKTDYQNDWDGTKDGSILQQGGYYYVVDKNNGEKVFSGSLLIVRGTP